MAKRQKTPLDEVTSRLGQLDRSELEELQDIVARFLAALDPEEETVDEELEEAKHDKEEEEELEEWEEEEADEEDDTWEEDEDEF